MPKALESGEIKIKSSWVYVGISEGKHPTDYTKLENCVAIKADFYLFIFIFGGNLVSIP